MNIIKATPQHLRPILEVMKIGSAIDYTDLIKKSLKAGQCQAAFMDDKIVGFAILGHSTFYRQAFMELIIIHPDYRRQGVATALIQRLETLCNTKKFFTSTNESNIPAQKTYEANGFIRSGYIENLDEGDPEIIYFKLLAGSGGKR